jgi:non-ribosomal peptide synthetase component E (peptide arylation enzyme)
MPPQLNSDLRRTNREKRVWQDRTLIDVVTEHADRRPERLAVADQHERITYADLVARAHALAAWLVQQGLEPGDAVVLQTPNRIALPLTHLACDIADLIVVPLSDAWRRTELQHLLGASQAKVVVVPSANRGFDHLGLVEELRDDLPDLRLVGSLDQGGGDFDFTEVSIGEASGGQRPRDPDAPRFVMVSSGTTDVPTMSLFSDNNLWFFMRQYGDHVGMGADDLAVGIAPANTGATGYVFPVLAPILHGAGSVLLEHWSPAEALDLIAEERATLATGIPTQIIKMLQEEDVRDHDFDALRVFNNAGAPLPPDVAVELEEVFGCHVQSVYGATDGGVPSMTRHDDPVEKRYTTVGRILPHTDVRLVDPLLADVAPGEPGEIMWRSPTKSHGYFNAPDRDAVVWLDDGYYRSGDLGQLDDEGYLRIVGRAKDMIIRGGQNLSPREIEEAVARHPAVAEVAVIGIPDQVYGERACACVQLRPGESLTLEELGDFLAGLDLATFKRPERLEVFDELPTSAGAKINKVALREAVAERAQGAQPGAPLNL